MNGDIARLHEWLDGEENNLIEATRTMLRIPSVETEAEPNAPYGEANRKALDYALSLCEERGLRTKDLEGHAGWAEFGGESGGDERLIMSLGHLDVVPVGPGWKHDPFGAEIDGGYIYARGAVDDKGPTMASLWAIFALKACFPDLGARVRQVFGCDEESGFGCMARYVQTEESPTYGIAPDSGWPCYHAEKRITDLLITAKAPEGMSMTLLKISGGSRPNIVIDSCEARARVSKEARAEVDDKLADAWDRNVTFSWEGDELGLYAVGKAAHGARPFDGDSAAVRMLRFLREIAPLDSYAWFDALMEAGHPGGAGLGVSGADDVVGDLTANLGVIDGADNAVTMLFNLRVPVKWTLETVTEAATRHLATLPGEWSFTVERDSPGLYFPLDHPLIQTIVRAYADETGETLTPGTMGGGTYARAVPNVVSVGTGWSGDGKAHETDERIKVDHLLKMAKIYARVLYTLAKV